MARGKCCAIGGFTVFCRFTHLAIFADRLFFTSLRWLMSAIVIGGAAFGLQPICRCQSGGVAVDRAIDRPVFGAPSFAVSAVPLMLALSLLVFFDNLFGIYTPHVYMCLIGMNLALARP